MIFLKNIKSILLSTFIFFTFLFFVSNAQEIGQINVTLNNSPVIGATVNAFGKTSVTDNKGVAKFDTVLGGNQEIKVNYNGKEYLNEVNINSSSINLQLSNSTAAASTSNTSKSTDSNMNYVSWIVIGSGILLVILGVKLFYDRVKNIDYRSRLMEKKMMLTLGTVACFVFIMGMFTQILSLTNINNTYTLNQSVNAGTDNINCLCNVNVCSNSCNFDKISGANYSTAIKCNREKGLSNTEPTSDDNNLYCKRTERTKGDADGNNIVEILDYMEYVRVVNGGLVTTSVNPDFNGDGVVSRTDRDILVQTLTK